MVDDDNTPQGRLGRGTMILIYTAFGMTMFHQLVHAIAEGWH